MDSNEVTEANILANRKHELATLSNTLGQWYNLFEQKFRRTPNEIGITDRLMMDLPSWISRVFTSGDVEGREGHDFVLRFGDRIAITLYIQAKNIDNGRVNFLHNYGVIEHADESWEKKIQMLEKELAKKEASKLAFENKKQQEKNGELDNDELNEFMDYQDAIEDTEKRMRVLQEIGKRGKRNCLQPDLLHYKIWSERSAHADDQLPTYIDGGFMIYGYGGTIGYVPITYLDLAYKWAITQAKSVTGFNGLIMEKLQNDHWIFSMADILTEQSNVPEYKEWKTKHFGQK
ncbi:hypothetical protein RhiJN_09365 [Ceratobasidium sp. AG-Ba]|nr:hypothetical protein RhiJN_09365 [Ceratobasidium sp. AG-Ba]QRW10129.1 hypothetical protein RhiLY_09128 [Ceratobasidium sp. AG-Ba]